MKVLVTGAGGFLGRGLVVPFVEAGHELRLMDVAPFESDAGEVLVGDVGDLETVRRAVTGMDAIVIAHMASRQARSYDTPVAPFDANVKGTANLLFAAVEAGIERIALVSSTGVVQQHKQTRFLSRDLPFAAGGMYRLTKVCQEVIAEQYHREHGVRVAVLRVGYIVDGDRRQDKYGKPFKDRNYQLTDRRDIGGVALAALELEDLQWEIFYVMSTDESMAFVDTRYTRERLGWRPRHPFKELPPPENRWYEPPAWVGAERPVRGVAHVCFTVRDLERSVAFYRDVLGLEPAFEFRRESGELYGQYLHAGGRTFVELFQGGDVAPPGEGQTYRHFCLEVADIARAAELVRSRGLEVSEVKMGSDGSWQAWLTDPDGNRIELHEYTGDSKQRPYLA